MKPLTPQEQQKLASLEADIKKLEKEDADLAAKMKPMQDRRKEIRKQIELKEDQIANITQTEMPTEDIIVSRSQELLALMGDFVTTEEALLKDEVGKFWVVTKPTGQSEMGDICFDVDLKGFMNQTRGGLKFEEIVALLQNEGEAKKLAQSLLDKQNGK